MGVHQTGRHNASCGVNDVTRRLQALTDLDNRAAAQAQVRASQLSAGVVHGQHMVGISD
jgi:hypothetical protein